MPTVEELYAQLQSNVSGGEVVQATPPQANSPEVDALYGKLKSNLSSESQQQASAEPTPTVNSIGGITGRDYSKAQPGFNADYIMSELKSLPPLEDQGETAALGGFGSFFSGKNRRTAITEALEKQADEVGFWGQNEFMDDMMGGRKNALRYQAETMTVFNPMEQAKIAQTLNPDIEIRIEKDAQGKDYPILINGNTGQASLVNEFGADLSDAAKMIGTGMLFLRGKGLKGGLGKQMGKEAVRSGAIQSAIEGQHALSGGDFNPADIAMAGAGGAIGEALPVIAKSAINKAKSLINKFRGTADAAPTPRAEGQIAKIRAEEAAKGFETDELGNLIGGDGGRQAQINQALQAGDEDRLAKMIDADPQFFKDKETLGLMQEGVPTQASKSKQIQQTGESFSKIQGSDLYEKVKLQQEEIGEKANELVNKYGATTKGSADFDLFEKGKKAIDNLSSDESKMYNKISQVVTKSADDTIKEGEVMVTHSGGDIGTIEQGGVFSGLFAKYGDESMYGIDQGGKQTKFIISQDKVAGAGDADFDYEKSIEFLKKENPDLSDDSIDELYEWVAEDASDPWSKNILEDTFEDAGEASWEAQRQRGQLAKYLGFDAVEMMDESGTSILIPSGSKARKKGGGGDKSPPVEMSTVKESILDEASNSAKGIDSLDSLQKEILDYAENGATYKDLDRLRRKVGESLHGKKDVFPNVSEGSLKNLYKLLTKDQEEAAKTLGVGELWDNAKEITKARIGLQDKAKTLFGNKLENKAVTNRISGALKTLSDGDPEKFNKMISALPSGTKEADAQRLQMIGTALKDVFKGGATKEEGFSVGQFAKWYEKLNASPAHKNMLFKELPKEMRTQLDAMGRLTGKIRQAYKAGSGTGLNLTSDAAINKIKKSAQGLVSRYINNLTFGAVNVGETLTRSEAKKIAIDKAANVLNSPQFINLVKAASNGKEEAVKSMEKSLMQSKGMQELKASMTQEQRKALLRQGFIRWMDSEYSEEE